MPTLIMAYPLPTLPCTCQNYSCFSAKFVPRMPPRIPPEECPQVAEAERKKGKKASIPKETEAGTECFLRLEEAPQNPLGVICISYGLWLGRLV